MGLLYREKKMNEDNGSFPMRFIDINKNKK